MDGENRGKPYFLMDDLGGFHPLFWEVCISRSGPKEDQLVEEVTRLLNTKKQSCRTVQVPPKYRTKPRLEEDPDMGMAAVLETTEKFIGVKRH